MIRLALLILLVLAPVPFAVAADNVGIAAHPEARPFDTKVKAEAEVDAALARARASEKMVLIVMGANWCHDSRALAGWLAQGRFAAMLAARYELVYVDIGMPQTGQGRNLTIAQRFGIKQIKGTPMVLMVSGQGTLLNGKKDAAGWRNAASRREEAIFRYFAEFTGV
ncbi:MAG: thioredoxin family protein [Sphingorhabdus sp.]